MTCPLLVEFHGRSQSKHKSLCPLATAVTTAIITRMGILADIIIANLTVQFNIAYTNLLIIDFFV